MELGQTICPSDRWAFRCAERRSSTGAGWHARRPAAHDCRELHTLSLPLHSSLLSLRERSVARMAGVRWSRVTSATGTLLISGLTRLSRLCRADAVRR